MVPIQLPTGAVLIYNFGQQEGASGIALNSPWRFADVYQVWAGGEPFIYGGQKVAFDSSQSLCKLTWDNRVFFVIEYAKLAGIEDI